MKADIRTMLRAKGLKQKDIAQMFGESETEISYILRGTKPIPQYIAEGLAKLLNLSPEEVRPKIIPLNHKGHDSRVNDIELAEGLMGVESNAQGLFYLLDKNTPWISRRKLSILAILEGNETRLTLTLKQATELLKEIEDICKMQWGEQL